MKTLGDILAAEGGDRAADHAGEEWKAHALEAVGVVAATGEEFTSEDVRVKYPDLDNPPDKRAWGGIMRRAAKQFQLVSVGTRKATNPKVHSTIVTVWKRA